MEQLSTQLGPFTEEEISMMIRKSLTSFVPLAALTLSNLAALPAPAFAQAQTPVVNGNQVCQTFISNAMPYGYVGVNNVDLGSVFSSIDTISGQIRGTRTNGPDTINIPVTAPVGMWGNQGYLVPAWGSTGGWKSFIRYLGGSYPGAIQLMQDVIDVRFGTDDGIHPGKGIVPPGVQGLYVVQRNETGHAPLRLNIQSFSLTICGKAKTGQQCQTLTYDESQPWSAGSKFNLPLNKNVVSVTGSYTVAAKGNTAAQTQTIVQPPGVQPRTGKFNVAYKNKEIFSVMLIPGVDNIPVNAGPGYTKYLEMNKFIRGSAYLHHAASFANGVQVPHGNVTGTVTVCVQ